MKQVWYRLKEIIFYVLKAPYENKNSSHVIIVFITTFVNAQLKDTSASKMSDHDLGMQYLQRSKSRKTAAWVLLSVGTTMTVIGFVGGANTIEDSNYPFISEEDASIMDAHGILFFRGIAADSF